MMEQTVSIERMDDIEFFSGPQYQAHSVDSHDFFRSELGITSDNYDIGARVVVNNFTDQLPAFFFGHIGHATGIDHKDIGAFFIGLSNHWNSTFQTVVHTNVEGRINLHHIM